MFHIVTTILQLHSEDLKSRDLMSVLDVSHCYYDFTIT